MTRTRRLLSLALIGMLLAGAPPALTAQAGNGSENGSENGSHDGLHARIAYEHGEMAPVARAVRTSEAIVIDGVLDEAVWMTAPPVTELWQTLPDEGRPASQRTEVRFLYDDENIYVGAWLWDGGNRVGRLARRDTGMPDIDLFVVYLDSYHDHRTAYRFAIGPTGMRRDLILSSQGQDTSWDPVWEYQATTADDMWFVEMRIPFSQLRYSRDEEQVWGLQIERKMRGIVEDAAWAFTPLRERGGPARYGHLVGIEGISHGKRLELLPYMGGRAEYRRLEAVDEVAFGNPYRSGADYFGNAGIDLKYRLSSNLTLDATINPDFGQVEMDPSVINLTAFETRFDEMRPFFREGAEIFRFGEAGMNSQLLYSRRIGREPQGSLPGSAVYADKPLATTILGAFKLTGKTADGWSVGVLNAVTGRESAAFIDGAERADEVAVEPLSNYFAGRLRRDLRDGALSWGLMTTAVHRDLADPTLRARLRSAAYTAGLDARLDWDNRAWTLSARLSPSFVRGDPAAIDLTQRSSARYLQRPDADHVSYDPEANSLRGLSANLDLSRQAGEWQGGIAATLITPGYEINDLGFQTAADRVFLESSFGYHQTRPGRHLRRWSVTTAPAATWNLGGDAQALELGFAGSGQLTSFHFFNWRLARQFTAWNDRLTRGGPATREPGGYSGNLSFNTDSRGPVQLRSSFNASADDAGGWHSASNLTFVLRFRGSYEFHVGPNYRRSSTPAQYVTVQNDPGAEHTFGRRYLFAELDQTTLGVQTRFNATFTPFLSLELYAQPFLSSGDYGALRELAAPRTFEFLEYGRDLGTISRGEDGRYTVDPYGDGSRSFTVSDLNFNYRSLLGNAVLRWEWRPGSTLYLVWQQSRSERLTPLGGDTALRRVGAFDLERDARALLGIRPDNIFLVKVDYWLNP